MRNYIRLLFYVVVLMASCAAAAADAYVDFFRALQIDNASAVGGWLMRGFDPNSRDEKGQPALLLAMREGSFKSAELLLTQAQLDVEAANSAKETPLMMAALKGHAEWCRRLLERGAKVNRDGWSPLHYAATGPSPEAVALLLDRGAAVDARAPNGNTPLMMAALYGKEESVLVLLKRGADPTLRNGMQRTAPELARASGRDFLLPALEGSSKR